jgi:hypothetical protein
LSIRHPRRLGFLAFNIIVLALTVLYFTSRPAPGEADVTEVPNVLLATVGIGLLLVAWLASWIGWGILVYRRSRRRAQAAAQ